LAALVDADGAALARAADAAGMQSETCFTSMAEAVRTIESDAALIVVPLHAHAAVALEALGAGLHCLIEKPFASAITEAQRIVEEGNRRGRIVMVSQQYRHRAPVRTIRRLVTEGAVGRVEAVSIRFFGVPAPGFQLEVEEPLLTDMAIHHFDLVRGMLGLEPTKVLAVSHNPSWSQLAGNAAASVILEADSGTVITYTGNWAVRGRLTGWEGVWDIFGESGSIHWDGDRVILMPVVRPLLAKIQGRAFKREWKGQRVKLAALRQVDRGGTLGEFSRAIREDSEPETSGRDNIRSLALTIAAVESARSRKPVDLADVLSVSAGHRVSMN
jgi:predicted dehydrogenase